MRRTIRVSVVVAPVAKAVRVPTSVLNHMYVIFGRFMVAQSKIFARLQRVNEKLLIKASL